MVVQRRGVHAARDARGVHELVEFNARNSRPQRRRGDVRHLARQLARAPHVRNVLRLLPHGDHITTPLFELAQRHAITRVVGPRDRLGNRFLRRDGRGSQRPREAIVAKVGPPREA